MATSTQINAITALYVGYFDRAPDPAGLQFWIDQLDNGREYNTIAADFAASPEAVALYPYLTTPDVSSPASFVTNIYANLFGRTPDQEGLDFWTGVLEDGSVSVADMIEAIIMGARDDEDAGTFDKSVLDNKVEVGLDFATSAAEVPGFEFDAAAKAAAVAAVNGVTEDEATVEAAKEATDAFVSGDSNPGTGDNLTLTAAIGESVVGGAGNDTFTGVVGDGTTGTLQFGDQLNGGAGKDTLNLFTASGADTVIPAGVSISNIEVVNLNGGAGVDGTPEINAAKFGAAAQEIWQVGTANDINGLASGQAAGFRNVDTNSATVEYKAGAENATIALDNVDDLSIVDLDGADLETVSVSGSVAAATSPAGPGRLGVDMTGATDVETFNLALTSDTFVSIGGFKVIETLDASASTGGITADLTSVSGMALESMIGGSGDEDITVDLDDFDAEMVTVTGNDGDDMLTFDTATQGGTNTSVTIEGGAGNDTIEFTGLLSNVENVSGDDFEGLITINGFENGDDVLALAFATAAPGNEGFAGVQNDIDVAVADASVESLVDALNAVAGTDGATQGVYRFDYDGDTYVYADNNTDGFDATDGLIKLTGGVELEQGVNLTF